MAENRRGGVIFFKIDSVLRDAKGNFTYNMGAPKREALINADLSIAGYKEMGQVPFIEGEITDSRDLILSDFLNIENATLTLELANGKVFTLRNAWFAADGNVQTEEGNIRGSNLRASRPRKPMPARPGLRARHRRGSRYLTSSIRSKSPLKISGYRSSERRGRKGF